MTPQHTLVNELAFVITADIGLSDIVLLFGIRTQILQHRRAVLHHNLAVGDFVVRRHDETEVIQFCIER